MSKILVPGIYWFTLANKAESLPTIAQMYPGK